MNDYELCNKALCSCYYIPLYEFYEKIALEHRPMGPVGFEPFYKVGPVNIFYC